MFALPEIQSRHWADKRHHSILFRQNSSVTYANRFNYGQNQLTNSTGAHALIDEQIGIEQ